MVSNEERREVASNLRKLSETDSIIGELKPSDEVFDSMCLRAIRATVGKGDIFERLADLIDRPATSIDVNKHGRAYCISCGCDDWCLADGDAHYCPCCGADVVE